MHEYLVLESWAARSSHLIDDLIRKTGWWFVKIVYAECRQNLR